jgi:hypothetical protein
MILIADRIPQGELEHRRPKGWHSRTDRKNFVKQMTQIERRQTRIRRIKHKLISTRAQVQVEVVATAPEAHHHIGTSQKRREHIPSFVHDREGDPAVQVSTISNLIEIWLTTAKNFMSKLKAHILPRIKALVSQDDHSPPEHAPISGTVESQALEESRLLLKHDCMYLHNVLRVNYTTYDVRRKRDSINPNTSHRDIMVLAENHDDSDHPFLYARVIGIFHVNVIYMEGTVIDYNPRKVEVLWVRWFEHDSRAPSGSWSHSRLNRLRFPPMAHEDSFSFLDPADVVRGCHIIPAFAAGKRYADGRGLSPCAGDSNDWRSYYVNRCELRTSLLFSVLT